MRRECEWVNAPNKMQIPFIVLDPPPYTTHTHTRQLFQVCTTNELDLTLKSPPFLNAQEGDIP
jgi:hypothetical protein